MKSKFIFKSIFLFLFLINSTFAALTPQAIAISDPKINKIGQFGDSIWAVGRGITIVDLKKSSYRKLHQDFMNLANTELIFNDIYKEKDGTYYLATNSGLWMLKDTTWTILKTSNSPLPSDTINCLAKGFDGMLWIGTTKGIVRKNGPEWELENFGVNFNVTSLTFDLTSDTTYICSNLHYFNILAGSELTPVSFPLVPLRESFQIIYEKVLKDRFGVKWIATSGTYGLIRWEDDKVEQLLMNSIPESIIEDLEFDKDLNIIGINADGYFKIDASVSDITQMDYELEQGVLGRAMTVCGSSDGTIWYGGTCPLTNRIAKVMPPKYIRYNNALMPGPFLNTFHSAANGFVFLANYNGLGIFDTHTFKFFDSTTHSSKLTGISDIGTNSKGDIYLISYNQLYKFTTDSLSNFLGDKYKTYSYYGLTSDSTDSLWFTSRRFIWRYFNGKVDSITIPGPQDNYCFTDIYIDKNNTKWIKTLNGFYGYRDNKWIDSIMPKDIPVKIRTFEDLKMYIDYNGDIWLTSINVIFKYDNRTWETLTSGELGVPKFGSLLDKVPTLNFVPNGKMYLYVDEKVFVKEGSLWLEPSELNPIYDKTYKIYVDINDNKWIYKADINSIAITMFRENGVYNKIDENIAQDDEQFAIYPNPATDFINVEVRFFEPKQKYEIYDLFGNRVLKEDTGFGPGSTRIDISSFPVGIYFLKLDNIEIPQKFVKY